MVRYRSNAIFADFSPESKTLLHALLQFIGGFLGIIGTLQKYWGKEVHFKSRHGKFGKKFVFKYHKKQQFNYNLLFLFLYPIRTGCLRAVFH